MIDLSSVVALNRRGAQPIWLEVIQEGALSERRLVNRGCTGATERARATRSQTKMTLARWLGWLVLMGVSNPSSGQNYACSVKRE